MNLQRKSLRGLPGASARVTGPVELLFTEMEEIQAEQVVHVGVEVLEEEGGGVPF